MNITPRSVRVVPDSQQLFSSERLCLSCDGDGWMVKRTRLGQTKKETCSLSQDFGQDFGNLVNSSCVLFSTNSLDTGSYWCEDGSGRRSQEVPITVTDGPLILESPALPVEAGYNVTLRCRIKNDLSLNPEIHRNGSLFSHKAEFTISNVQKSDEDIYYCYIPTAAASPKSWLRVKDPAFTPPPSSSSLLTSCAPSADSRPPPPLSSSAALPVAVALGSLGLAVLLLVLVLVLLRRRRQMGNGHTADSEEVTYADVTVRQAVNQKERCREADTVYSGVKTHAAGP